MTIDIVLLTVTSWSMNIVVCVIGLTKKMYSMRLTTKKKSLLFTQPLVYKYNPDKQTRAMDYDFFKYKK